jgi:peptidoglycan/LPS O-acetylase OafA/YrhL
VFDALATGCLLAFAAPRIARTPWCARVFDSRWFWAITLLGVAAMVIRNPLVRYGASMTIANIAIAMIIVRCAARPQSRVSRMFERRSLVWIGTLSYSLYLWQQLFLNRHADGWIHQFPVNIGLALLAATGCHYLIERPMLRFADRWRIKEQPTNALGDPNVVLDVSVARARRSSTASEPAVTWDSPGPSPRETLA